MVFFASLSCMKANLGFIPTLKMSIPSIKHTSQSKTNIQNSNPPKISKTFRDASFSSYIHGAEDTFVLKRLNSPISTFSTPYDHIFNGRNLTDDGEIGVFNAEKYFSEGLTHMPKVSTKNLSGHQVKKDDPIELFEIKEQTRVATPSIRSESSSNSRSMLLKKLSKNQQPRRINKKSFLASIGCNGSCNDKKSLEVDDCSDNGKSKLGDKTRDGFAIEPEPDYNCVKFDEPGLRVDSSGNFSFRVSNSRPGNKNQAVSRPGNENQAQATGQKSVFCSPIQEKVKKNSLTLEKNLTMLSWDEIKIPSKPNEIYNDTESDASSDLFEIESFSTGNHFLSRQVSDGLSGCYAPSEASIEWSVITANAVDNFSVPSDSKQLKSNIPHFQKVGSDSNNGSSLEMSKRRSSIFSGCKNQKAVRVAENAHRSNYKAFSNGRSEFKADSSRFHNKTKLAGNAANLLYT